MRPRPSQVADGKRLTTHADRQIAQVIESIGLRWADSSGWIQPAVGERLLESLERVPRQFESLESPDPLTDRETEILRLIAAGLSNREIAETFEMSAGTVKNHTSSILSKLGVRDRTRAVLKALDRGYI